jgi:hypothetical protein
MKLTAILSIGSYYSPWFTYGIASIYNHVDEIIVSNVGYDLENPDINKLVPLDRVTDEIKRLDVNGKIVELRNITPNTPEHKMVLTSQKIAEQKSIDNWCDVRGLGITSANDEARRRDAEWILKLDSDQACYKDIVNIKRYLNSLTFDGIYLHQYEFIGDVPLTYYKGTPQSFLSSPSPTSPYNDSMFAYRAFPGQYYGGGGSPALYLRGQDRIGTGNFHCAHLRQANPTWLTEEEKYLHFYGRYLFAEFTNHYGEFNNELVDKAIALATEKMKQIKGLDDVIAGRIGIETTGMIKYEPPEVCNYRDVLEYINAGY